MKTLTTKLFAGSLAAALLIAGCGADTKQAQKAPKADAGFATKVAVDSKSVTAKKVAGDLNDMSLWADATFSKVALYPQTTIAFNDKDALKLNEKNGAKIAKVAALYNDKEVAVSIIWKDKSENAHNGKCVDTYADGVAFQFAKEVKDPKKLPYIGMGSKDREVAIYLQKVQFNNFEPNGKGNVDLQVSRNQTNFYDDDMQYTSDATGSDKVNSLTDFDNKVASIANNDFERKFVAAGFRSMTEIKDGSDKSKLTIARIDGYGWIATLVRPIKDQYADLSKSFPVAFAVWDGDKLNRNGMKLLSGWNAVTVGKENKALVDVINDTVPKGDVKNGAEQAVINCGSCHAFPGAMPASPYMAPDLNNIGGYATAAYIKESMVAPHAVVVPGYNRNAHKNFPWYTVNGKKRESTMPGMSYLDAKTLNDITAYFKTLKAKVETPKVKAK
jgi:complex iron-sulfur molybdoenzyme family reductase subunit gamma